MTIHIRDHETNKILCGATAETDPSSSSILNVLILKYKGDPDFHKKAFERHIATANCDDCKRIFYKI